MRFPSACPEIPVSDLGAGLAYYRDRLGFHLDWTADEIGLACVSRGDSRLFMADAEYRSALGNRGPMVVWVNLDGREAVDALHAEWSSAGAGIVQPPEAKPYKLYEFLVQDPDGNLLRVFYDFAWEEKADDV